MFYYKMPYLEHLFEAIKLTENSSLTSFKGAVQGATKNGTSQL